VDVIAVAASGESEQPAGSTVVHDVRVLAIPARGAPSSDGTDTGAGLLIVAADNHQATALARASTTSQLSVAVQPPA
jgi:Flp pilus assembly protein CpaB